MKAVVLEKYGSPYDLRIKEVPKPTPTDNQVLIKIHAAAVNDWDWSLVRGKPIFIRMLCGFSTPKIAIPGVDVAGEVEAVGAKVTKFQVGDAVYGDLSESGFGGFAEFVCAPEHILTPKPKKMSFTEAAALPHAAALAVQGLIDKGKLHYDQRVLINGAGGGVGTLGVQIANAVGVKDITGVDHTDKLAMMHTVGFHHTVDYTKEDFTKNGQAYDLILDTKTNRSAFSYRRALAPHGVYTTVGGALPSLFAILVLGSFLNLFGKKNLSIVSLQTNKGLDYINKLYEEGALSPIIEDSYPLGQASKAIQHFGDGTQKGKIVITMG